MKAKNSTDHYVTNKGNLAILLNDEYEFLVLNEKDGTYSVLKFNPLNNICNTDSTLKLLGLWEDREILLMSKKPSLILKRIKWEGDAEREVEIVLPRAVRIDKILYEIKNNIYTNYYAVMFDLTIKRVNIKEISSFFRVLNTQNEANLLIFETHKEAEQYLSFVKRFVL